MAVIPTPTSGRLFAPTGPLPGSMSFEPVLVPPPSREQPPVEEPAPTDTDANRARATTEDRLTALADFDGVLAELLGVDRYFLVEWVRTITSPETTRAELQDATRAMFAALNHVIRNDKGEHEGGEPVV
jgi:hypothetical protein